MQTNIAAPFRGTPDGVVAEKILRKCVHCGFCNATCPTYQMLGDELDGPRGRIYQVKQVLEGAAPTAEVRLHLDRCLTCRSCETTCPSGVEYGKLVDIGRRLVEQGTRRPLLERTRRYLLDRILSRRRVAALLFGVGRIVSPLLPRSLAAKIPARQAPLAWRSAGHSRTVLMLEGCVQPTLTPRTDQAAELLLDRVGVGVVRARDAGCCGALSHHLSFEERALASIRRNVDAWWPSIQNGVEAIMVTASGCAVMVRDYGHLLRDDPVYAERAARVSSLVRDLSDFLIDAAIEVRPRTGPVAFHSPCTHQHGLRLDSRVETLLHGYGYKLTEVADSHICCGSAGTYSLLQPVLSRQLLENKLENLTAGLPEVIATANVGCQVHLMSRSSVPVLHWAEMLAEDLVESSFSNESATGPT